MSCSHWNCDPKSSIWYESNSPKLFKDLPTGTKWINETAFHFFLWTIVPVLTWDFVWRPARINLGLREKCPTLLLPVCETQHWPSHKFSQLNAVSASQDKIGVQDDTNMIYTGICVAKENLQDSWIKLTNGIFLHAWTLPYFTWASTWADKHLARHRNTPSWVFRMFFSLLPTGQFECELQVVLKIWF